MARGLTGHLLAHPNRPPKHWYLIRGLARESAHWGDFPEVLAKANRKLGTDISVTLLDLPGTGKHSAVTSPHSIAEVREFVRHRFAETLGRRLDRGEDIDAPRGLIAISLGGMVAVDWLTHHPGDFEAAVLINSSFAGISPIWKRLRPSSLPRLWKIATRKSADEAEREVLQMVSNRADRRQAALSSWSLARRLRPVAPISAINQILAAARFRLPATPPETPTLLLASQKDRMVHCDCSLQLAERWNLPLSLHPTAGHDLPLDAPEWVAFRIAEWSHGLPVDDMLAAQGSGPPPR